MMFSIITIDISGLIAVGQAMFKVLRLRQPGMVFLYVSGEGTNMLKFVLLLPQKSAPDVKSREVSLQIGAAEPKTLTLSSESLETEELLGKEGEVVKGSLVDIDDAGNRSPARDFEYTLTDSIAPGQPGELSLKVTDEVEDPVDEEIEDEETEDETVEA